MLENEGEAVPVKKYSHERDVDEENEKESDREAEDDKAEYNTKEGSEEGLDSEDPVKGEPRRHQPQQHGTEGGNGGNNYDKRTTTKPTYTKPMTYGERTELIKKRKQDQREEKEAYFNKRKEEHNKRELKRVRHKQQMTKFTARGQPMMGPRINRLLDKIKESTS